jgi:uncharacterized protein RhaS with RHS repeats
MIPTRVVDPADKSFDDSTVIATVDDPTQSYEDDSVLDDDDDYDYLIRTKEMAEDLYFYHTDHLGTPLAMTDDNGTVMWRAEYRPFGDLDELVVDAVALRRFRSRIGPSFRLGWVHPS